VKSEVRNQKLFKKFAYGSRDQSEVDFSPKMQSTLKSEEEMETKRGPNFYLVVISRHARQLFLFDTLFTFRYRSS